MYHRAPARFLGAVFAAALAGGALAALFYHRLGLTLSHYDARGHLIVARRIFDSITPGWQQIGAVWLPLPHLLNAIPVQIDAFYRTGASAVAISVVVVRGGGRGDRLDRRLADRLDRRRRWPARSSSRSTQRRLPAGDADDRAAAPRADGARRRAAARVGEAGRRAEPSLGVAAGVVLALACLTRYEAWPVAYAALAAAAWTRWRRGEPLGRALRRVGAIAVYPTLALIGFAFFSRVVVGQWFVSSDFFVPENKAQGLPMAARRRDRRGARRELSGRALVGAGRRWRALLLVALGLAAPPARAFLIPVALAATAAVPWLAFLEGHPFRIRYMVPLIAFEARGGRRLRRAGRRARADAGVRRSAGWPSFRPCSSAASPSSRSVRSIRRRRWSSRRSGIARTSPSGSRSRGACARATTAAAIMASMGSLGHYMQETSRDGFDAARFPARRQRRHLAGGARTARGRTPAGC